MVQTPVVCPRYLRILSVMTTHSSFTGVVYFTLKMEAEISLETLLPFDQTTRRHNPDACYIFCGIASATFVEEGT